MPISNNAEINRVLASVIYDYTRTMSLIFELDSTKSKVIKVSDIPYFAFKKMLNVEAFEFYEVMQLVDYVNMAVNVGNLTENSLQTVVPNVDIASIGVLYMSSNNSNKIIKEILAEYPDVKKLLSKIVDFNYMRRESFLAEAKQNLSLFRDEYEILISSKEIEKFLNDFSMLQSTSNINIIRASFLGDINSKNERVILCEKKIVLLPELNYLTFFDVATKGLNKSYQNFSLSNIVYLEKRKRNIKTDLAELRDLKNFSTLINLFGKDYEDEKNEFHEHLARVDFSEKLKNSKYNEILKIISSHAKNNKLTPSGIFAIEYVLYFKSKIQSRITTISSDIKRILSAENTVIAFKLLEIELYMEREFLTISDGKKINYDGEDGAMLMSSLKDIMSNILLDIFKGMKHV